MGTPQEYAALTERVATAELPAGRLRTIFQAMMRLESIDFSPDVVECRRDSPAGARGLCQLMPVHWSQVDPCDPPAALAYGARLFKAGVDRYSNPRAGAASYNAGMGAVDRLQASRGLDWERGLPAETRTYLRVVMQDALWNGPLATFDDDRLSPFDGGEITQEYGYTPYSQTRPFPYGEESPGRGKPHTGVDVAGVPRGTLIQALWPGIVDWMGENPSLTSGYGLTVVVNIGSGLFASYNHCAGFVVFTGNVVRAGDALAYVGSTGHSTGDHTHIELRTATGAILDPGPYMRAKEPPPPAPPPLGPSPDQVKALWLAEWGKVRALADENIKRVGD